jgi:type II secretory pathway component GspD/PulD (secretin)
VGNSNTGSKFTKDAHLKTLVLHSLLIFIIGISPVMAESMKMEVIELKHGLVSEIVPVLKPLVAKGGTVTGMNNSLIIKTTSSNLKQIKSVLAQLDKTPRRLMISVKQNVDGNFKVKESGLSGRYSNKNVTVVSPDTSNKGTVIQGNDSDGNVIRYRTTETKSYNEDRNIFRVQTLEGNHAFISTGKSVPIPTESTVVTAGGVVTTTGGIEYRDVTSGFYVLPRLQGNNVTLLVAPELSRVTPGQAAVFDVQNVETTASGKLGEWIQLGGATQSFNDNSKRNAISTKRRGREQRTVLIKVEEIK